MATTNDTSDFITTKLITGGVFLNVLKLHKLLYYVQAWNLAYANTRLFPSSFQAWVHGPVCRDIYDRYVGYKTMYSSVGMSDVDPNFTPERLATLERAHVDAVLEVYGDLTGDQLEELTHRESPWINARGNLPSSARSEAVISDADMSAYYRSLAAR